MATTLWLLIRSLMTNRYLRISKITTFGLVLLICFLPLIPGISALLLGAFGINPLLNEFQLTPSGFQDLVNYPGIGQSIVMTIAIAVVSTFFSVAISFSILKHYYQKPIWQKLETLLPPMLALPHVAFAIGFAFLFTPSGFMARIVEQAFGLIAFDELKVVKQPLGLILVLCIKEIPFLIYMSIPLLRQLNIKQTVNCAKSLGYHSNQTWNKIIFAQWFIKMRVVIIAVLAYSLSVVDVSLIIGPSLPSTLPVLIFSWLNDADLSLYLMATSAALVLLIIGITLVYGLLALQWVLVSKYSNWQISGRHSTIFNKLPSMSGISFLAIIGLMMLSIFITIIWSFAKRWPYPELMPTSWSLQFWQSQLPYISNTLLMSIGLAIFSALIAILLTITLLQINYPNSVMAHKKNGRTVIPLLLIIAPIIAPQLSILLGIQLAIIYIDVNSYLFWVLWAHVLFVFPYTYLSIEGPWKTYHHQLDKAALSLGKSKFKTWWTIKFPILLPSILIALAVGMSVSFAQFLPTIMLGAGRISTITTEAVALSSGQDRRVMAIYAILQMLLPLLIFLLAIISANKVGDLTNRRPQKKHFKEPLHE